MPSREEIVSFLKQLREEIILNFLSLESKESSAQFQALFTFTGRISATREAPDAATFDAGIASAISKEKDAADGCLAAGRKLTEKVNHAQFQRTSWKHHTGGGGEIALLRGRVFEKAAVNWSGVWGDTFPMGDGMGPFFATGISLITHMNNPHAPTVHMNIRYIETEQKFWFGGGYDLTPMGFPYEEDTEHFHKIAKETLGEVLYQQFSKNAAEYFYIPHYKKERGVGGIFFDHYNTGCFSKDFELWKSVGSTFLKAILPIYTRRVPLSFTPEEKEKQLFARAHYVEFNLLYDRGTQFGFRSGGNPEAILCSMPPLVRW